MGKQWHDINSPGFLEKKNQPLSQAPEDVEEVLETVEQEPEVTLGKPELVEPETGFEFNKPCQVRVKVTFLKETVKKRIHFNLYSYYKDIKETTATQVYGFPDKEGIAVGDIKKLFAHDDYLRDNEKPPDARFHYEVEAFHSTSREPVLSDKYDFPLAPRITFFLNDEEGNPIQYAEVELDTHEVFQPDENGRVIIEKKEGHGDQVDIIDIRIKDAPPEQAPVQTPHTASQAPQNASAGTVSPQIPTAGIPTGITPPESISQPTEILLTSDDGSPLSGATLTLAGGRSYTSDGEGKISIEPDGDQPIEVTNIELPA